MVRCFACGGAIPDSDLTPVPLHLATGNVELPHHSDCVPPTLST